MISINDSIAINDKEYTKNAAYFVTVSPELRWIGYIDILDSDKVVFHENLMPRTYEELENLTDEEKLALVTAEVDEILARPEIAIRVSQFEDAVSKGYIQSWNFTTPVINEVETLREYMNQGILNLYKAKLDSGFTSSASGKAVSFAYADSDQTKFHKLLTAMTAGLVPYPYTVWDKDSNAVPMTQAQLQLLFRDIMIFENTLQGKLHQFLDQVKNAGTMEELKAIEVVF